MVILHPKEKHTNTLIWLHGLGQTAEEFIQVFLDNRILENFPKGCKIVIPTAPIRKVTVNGGEKIPSWFDQRTFFNTLHIDANQQFFTEHFDQKELSKSVKIVKELI